MKRLKPGIWVCFCLCATLNLMGQNKVKTTAERVMLFIDGAQVTRTKQVDIPAGKLDTHLYRPAPYMDSKSMQVSAKGRLTIAAVNRQFNYMDSLTLGKRQEELQRELKRVEKQQKERNAELGLIKAEHEMLTEDKNISVIDALRAIYTSNM